LYVDSFALKYGDGFIELQSEEQKDDAPLNVNIGNFHIATVTEILQQDTLLANGLLNSKLRILQPTTDLRATGALTIDGLSVMGDTVGNVNVDLMEASVSEVATTITLKGRGNDVLVKGSYYSPPRNASNFDMKIDINSLDMANAEGFAMNQLKNSS